MIETRRSSTYKKLQPEARSPVSADIELGKRIRARRIEQNMSQDELGKLLGVSFQQIQKYEKGANRVNAIRLSLIASALKVQPGSLLQSDGVLADVASLIDVTDKSTLRMLKAWSKIKEQAAQRAIVALVETIAAAEKDD